MELAWDKEEPEIIKINQGHLNTESMQTIRVHFKNVDWLIENMLGLKKRHEKKEAEQDGLN